MYQTLPYKRSHHHSTLTTAHTHLGTYTLHFTSNMHTLLDTCMHSNNYHNHAQLIQRTTLKSTQLVHTRLDTYTHSHILTHPSSPTTPNTCTRSTYIMRAYTNLYKSMSMYTTMPHTNPCKSMSTYTHKTHIHIFHIHHARTQTRLYT